MKAFIDEGCELWTRKFIRRNLWRFHGEYDADDLYSEAWLVFDKIAKKYGDKTIKHLMALYKTSLANQFHRMAKQNSWRENLCDIAEAAELETGDPMVACLVDAPPEVRDALAALLTADPKSLDGITSSTGRRETYDERFHRIIDGAPENIATKIRDFLRADDYVEL